MCLPVDFLEDPICVSIILHDLEAHLSDQYLPVQPWRPEMEAGRGGGGVSQNNTEAHPAGGGSAGAHRPGHPHFPLSPIHVAFQSGQMQHVLLATSSLGSWAGIKGKHAFDPEPGGGRR